MGWYVWHWCFVGRGDEEKDSEEEREKVEKEKGEKKKRTSKKMKVTVSEIGEQGVVLIWLYCSNVVVVCS